MKKAVRNFLVLVLSIVMVLTMVQPELAATGTADSSSAVSSAEESVTSDTSTQEESETEETASDSQGTSASETIGNSSSSSDSSDNQNTASETAASADEQKETAADASGVAGTKKYTKKNDYTVTATYGEDAGLPEDVELKVKEITDQDKIDSYKSQAADALNGDDIAQARFFDISFVSDGKEVEPASSASVEVKISLTSSMKVEAGQSVKAVHFEESSNTTAPKVLDVNTTKDKSGNVKAVDFKQSSFSITGVVVTGDKLDSEGWPEEEGSYAVIIQKGDAYYAVKNDGSLTAVNITTENGEKKASFVDITDSDDLKDYSWDFSKTYKLHLEETGDSVQTGKLSNGIAGNTVYLDPSQNNAVSEKSKDLVMQEGKLATYEYAGRHNEFGWSRDYDYYKCDKYLTTTTNAVAAGTNSSSSASNVFFANQFEAAGSDEPGTPGGGDEGNLDAPTVGKDLTSNDDGTYKLTLSVTGQAKSVTEKTKAEVLVVFDTSGSMSNKIGSGWYSSTRLTEAKEALNSLTDQLMEYNTTTDPDTVRMSLLSFNTKAGDASEWTNNASSFKSEINNLNADGGTNWEDALKKANNVTFDEGVEKYVIFVSDGNPTYYVTPYGEDVDQTKHPDGHGGWKDNEEGIYGTGNDKYPTTVRLSYNAAKDDARNIVTSGKNFYTIGAYGDVTRMSNLTAYAYSGNDIGTYPAGHYQEASDTEALNAAFKQIVSDITKDFGYDHVVYTDGITSMTSTALAKTDGNFTYTITRKDGSTITKTGNSGESITYEGADGNKTFQGAVYDPTTNKVTWNMGDDFQLEDGVKYEVSFNVWPSQDAYDLIAALNNGTKNYDDLDEATKSQIEKKTEGNETTYTLKSNTDDTQVSYNKVTTTTDSNGNTTTTSTPGGTVKVENPDGMPLVDTRITLKKDWNDEDGQYRPDSVVLQLWQDRNADGTGGTMLYEFTLSSDNEWKTSYSIAPGLVSKGVIRETGHKYELVEVNTNPHYEFETQIYHPMLVDSTTVMYDGYDAETQIPGEKLTDSDGNVEFKGTNYIKRTVSITKHVYDVNGKDITMITNEDGSQSINPAIKDDEFEFSVKLVTDGNYTAADAVAQFGYAIYDQSGQMTSGKLTECSRLSGQSIVPSYDAAAQKTTVEFSVKLKPGEKFEVTAPDNTNYTVAETTEGNGANAKYTFKDWSITEPGTADSSSVTGELTDNERVAQLTADNTKKSVNVALYKKNADDQYLKGAEFTLKKVDGENETAATDIDGNEITNIKTNGDGKFVFGYLPDGRYHLTETKAPDGYVKLTSDVYFTVDNSKAYTEDAVVLDANNHASLDFTKDDQANVTEYKVVVKDDKIYELPQAGGHGIYWNTILGTLIAMFFAYAGFTMRRRKKGGNEA